MALTALNIAGAVVVMLKGNMRFGAMNFPVRPVLEELDAIGALQMDYLELAMDSPMAHYRLIREQKDAIRRTLWRWKMGLVCHLKIRGKNSGDTMPNSDVAKFIAKNLLAMFNPLSIFRLP